MFSFGRHSHRYRNAHHRRLTPLAIVLICVGAALIVSLIVGNLLKLFLDEETYNRLVSPDGTPEVSDPVVTKVPDVNAYPFAWSSSVQNATAHVSIEINTSDGKLSYSSPVAAHLGLAQTETVDFTTSLQALANATDYISGVFHPQALTVTDSDLQYAVAATERAVLREFLSGGGNEILLSGMEINLNTLPQITSYVQALKSDINGTVGVAISLSAVQSASGWELVGTLLKSCDYCALDLRGAATDAETDIQAFLKGLSYYLLQYDMRLLIDESQTELAAALPDSDVTDFQIVAPVSKTDTAPEAQPPAADGSVG